MLLILLVRGYRMALGPLFGGQCRFHPSCSAYAEAAIRNAGAVRGTAMAGWRILRCSPLTAGGVDYPPGPRERRTPVLYDGAIRHPSQVDPVVRAGPPARLDGVA